MAEISETLRLVELTCARLCHELGGLAGTLGGAIELSREEQPAESETLRFAQRAADELVQRLRLLRAAWGPDSGPVALDAMRRLSKGLASASRVMLDTTGLAPATVFPAPYARLTLNLLLLAAESLPAGGRILLRGSPTELFCAIEGPRAAWSAGLAAMLDDEAAAFAALSDARVVQAPLTALLARGHGVPLALLLAHSGDQVPLLRLGGR